SWAEDRVIVEGDSMPFEISANVTLASDYRFRGISQSDESIALQGGFDAEFGAGFYIGTWGSTVDFDTNGEGYDGSLELDYYAGWASDLGDSGLGIDVGFLYYDYPGDDDEEGDYWEVYGSMSWNDLAVGVHYSDDYYAETGEFWYVYADYGFTLFADIGLGLHVGYNMLDEAPGFLSSDEDTYFDYSVSVSKEWAGVEWALAWVGTDLDDDDVFGTDWADDTVVFSISKSM
ncbi:MAG: TorF family putative porin, partial [Halioglobus sp.]